MFALVSNHHMHGQAQHGSTAAMAAVERQIHAWLQSMSLRGANIIFSLGRRESLARSLPQPEHACTPPKIFLFFFHIDRPVLGKRAKTSNVHCAICNNSLQRVMSRDLNVCRCSDKTTHLLLLSRSLLRVVDLLLLFGLLATQGGRMS